MPRLGVEQPREPIVTLVYKSPYLCMYSAVLFAFTLMYNYLWTDIWRRGWDSNPRYPQGYNGFRDRPVRPLRHPSKLNPVSPREH